MLRQSRPTTNVILRERVGKLINQSGVSVDDSPSRSIVIIGGIRAVNSRSRASYVTRSYSARTHTHIHKALTISSPPFVPGVFPPPSLRALPSIISVLRKIRPLFESLSYVFFRLLFIRIFVSVVGIILCKIEPSILSNSPADRTQSCKTTTNASYVSQNNIIVEFSPSFIFY